MNDETFVTMLIKTKDLLHFKVFKLGQILHVDKTCFLRPGHNCKYKDKSLCLYIQKITYIIVIVI